MHLRGAGINSVACIRALQGPSRLCAFVRVVLTVGSIAGSAFSQPPCANPQYYLRGDSETRRSLTGSSSSTIAEPANDKEAMVRPPSDYCASVSESRSTPPQA